ncbi:MAG: AraC family transcriptional regulator [Paludibacteraceae bacterium]|nr:AraC family transcriptional regulator [Paludibacteraceae bacterium]
MTTLDPQAMEQQVRDIEQLDAVVFHGVSKFPTTQTVVLPKLVIVLVRQGRGKLMFDNTELSVSANDVYILPAKHIFSGTFTSFDHEVTMLILSDKLVEDARLTAFNYHFEDYHVQPVTHLTESQMRTIAQVMDLFETVLTHEPVLSHRHNALCSVLHVLIEFMNSFRKSNKTQLDSTRRGSHIYIKLMDLLAEHYTEQHQVQFYADKLGLTPKYMSKLILDATGFGANAWIDQYILAKAKLLLISRGDLSVQEISHMLGFKEQASFTRFFHNIEKISPREFRQEHMI